MFIFQGKLGLQSPLFRLTLVQWVDIYYAANKSKMSYFLLLQTNINIIITW